MYVQVGVCNRFYCY